MAQPDMKGAGMCDLCGRLNSAADHTIEIHNFNCLLFEYNNYRKALVKNRNGIEISQCIETRGVSASDQAFDVNKGRYTVKISPEKLRNLRRSIKFKFVVKNQRNKDSIYLVLCDFLHPLGSYRIEDDEGIVHSRKYLELKPKESYPIYVYFEPSKLNIGEYSNHLAFKFQDSAKDQFTFFRNLLVSIQDHNVTEVTGATTHFKGEYWADDVIKVPAMSKQVTKDEYLIPEEYTIPILVGLKHISDLPPNERNTITSLNKILGRTNRQTGEFESNLAFQSYADIFHILLWLEEACQALSLRQYNLSNVTMSLVLAEVLELEVEGLAEKRPSLLAGDLVYIRFHGDHTAYEGVIKTVNDKTIWIYKVNPILLEIVESNECIEFDVTFQLSRLTFERKHKAVDMCLKKGLRDTLFPNVSLLSRKSPVRYKAEDLSFFNQNIRDNTEQKIAVVSILNETSFPAPYIVFGPPGTGKTVTIVEAILQIKKHKPNSKILICAPSNAACDMLTIKLTENKLCTKHELKRIHTESRNWSDVPASVKPFSNHDGIDYTRLEAYQIQKCKIVITTLVLIGKFAGQYTPDYVFVDEAAQAQEPEADIAISMASTAKVVLAGDPKQLGPICQSRIAQRKGLAFSILERLMDRELYREYDPRYISMLRLNYRAHMSVLHVPNQLFYSGQLRAINKAAENDKIATLCVAQLLNTNQKKAVRAGFPVEFYSVIAQEQRKGKSPSFYNPAEVDIVVKHVVSLMQQNYAAVKQEDIGIVAPYIRQVHRLKEELRKLNYSEVEVGTTEAYQGREKRILIISTVRGKSDLLLYDKKYDLGFVQNERRMNVALTRAMSKLIIIGNPMVLNSNIDACKQWRYLIDFCQRNNSVFGMPFARRDAQMRKEITTRIITYDQNRQQKKQKNKKQNGRK